VPYKENSFDVALFRGVLHHLDRPRLAISEAFRVAKTIIALEPNGYNPGLKLLEKCSKYHIRHGEKSYLPFQLDKWLNEFGGTIIGRRWVGLVPCFCPDWLAKLLKVTEPAVERTPGINLLACAVYIVAAARDEF
jgi:SAM-dependent methyltransferase